MEKEKEKTLRPIALRLPLSLRERATQFAKRDQVSLSYFISIAVSERISRLEGIEAANQGREGFRRRSTDV